MRRLALLFWIALSLAANLAHAETYPSRPITLLVPAAAGGGNDTVARVVAEKMGKLLGQQIVIENRPGAGGSLAARQVARSEPDGYTIGIGNPAVLAIAPAMLPNVGYDPVKDFAPVGMIAASPHIILINNSIPAKTLAEFIALAKAEPGKYTFASGGAGQPGASRARAAREHRGHQAHARALQGHRTRDRRPARRARQHDLLQPAARDRPGARRQGAPDRDRQPEALGAVAGRPDSVRDPARLRVRRSATASLRRRSTPPAIVAKLNAALREALDAAEVKSRVEAEGAETTRGRPRNTPPILRLRRRNGERSSPSSV